MEVVDNDDLILIRCIVTGDNGRYYKVKDYLGNKYLIKKNKHFSNYSIGDDRTFYAYKRAQGSIFKKVVLFPITHEQYISINGNNGIAGKTLKELGINLNKLNEY